MIINNVDSNPQGKLSTFDALDAYDPELQTRLFARGYTHQSELLDVLDQVGNAKESGKSRSAVPDASNGIIARFLPNVRCSG